MTLVGEPGVGKSRLVWELSRHIDDLPLLVRWRQGRCLPYGNGVAFWALGEVVKADADILDSDDLQTATAKLDRALADDFREREWMRLRLLPLIGIALDQQVEQEESFTAWRKYVESLAADGPAVLVFEDPHWADASLIAFLHHLAERSDGYPILLVCTARPELYDQHPGWADGLRNATRIDLALLSPEETVLDHRSHRLEVAAHHPAKGPGIEALAHRSRPRDVGEQHRHGLAHLSRGPRRP